MRIATVNVTTDLGDEGLPLEEGRRSTYGVSRRDVDRFDTQTYATPAQPEGESADHRSEARWFSAYPVVSARHNL
jgi:hypothetical protein